MIQVVAKTTRGDAQVGDFPGGTPVGDGPGRDSVMGGEIRGGQRFRLYGWIVQLRDHTLPLRVSLFVMSEYSRWLELKFKIDSLDARYADPAPSESKFTNIVRRWREHRARYLHKIYETGVVPRKAVESLVVHEEVPIPPKLLENWAPPAPLSEVVSFPESLLFPKPKKPGRPKKGELHKQASDLHCSERHARRLVETGLKRQRDRTRSAEDVKEALKARKQRAALVAELEVENILYWLSADLYRLADGQVPKCSAPPPASRIPLRKDKDQRPNLRAMVCSALAVGDASYAARLLKISRATLYRLFRGKLGKLRKRGNEIAHAIYANPDLDLAAMACQTPPDLESRVVEGDGSAWEEQTRQEQTQIRPSRGRRE